MGGGVRPQVCTYYCLYTFLPFIQDCHYYDHMYKHSYCINSHTEGRGAWYEDRTRQRPERPRPNELTENPKKWVQTYKAFSSIIHEVELEPVFLTVALCQGMPEDVRGYGGLITVLKLGE